MAARTLSQTETLDELTLYTLRRQVKRQGKQIAVMAGEIIRLQADLACLREALFPTETVYPPDGPPEEWPAEIADPYADAPEPVYGEEVRNEC